MFKSHSLTPVWVFLLVSSYSPQANPNLVLLLPETPPQLGSQLSLSVFGMLLHTTPLPLRPCLLPLSFHQLWAVFFFPPLPHLGVPWISLFSGIFARLGAPLCMLSVSSLSIGLGVSLWVPTRLGASLYMPSIPTIPIRLGASSRVPAGRKASLCCAPSAQPELALTPEEPLPPYHLLAFWGKTVEDWCLCKENSPLPLLLFTLKCRHMKTTGLSSSTKLLILPKKEIRLVWHDLLLANPCWLLGNWLFYNLF